MGFNQNFDKPIVEAGGGGLTYPIPYYAYYDYSENTSVNNLIYPFPNLIENGDIIILGVMRRSNIVSDMSDWVLINTQSYTSPLGTQYSDLYYKVATIADRNTSFTISLSALARQQATLMIIRKGSSISFGGEDTQLSTGSISFTPSNLTYPGNCVEISLFCTGSLAAGNPGGLTIDDGGAFFTSPNIGPGGNNGLFSVMIGRIVNVGDSSLNYKLVNNASPSGLNLAVNRAIFF